MGEKFGIPKKNVKQEDSHTKSIMVLAGADKEALRSLSSNAAHITSLRQDKMNERIDDGELVNVGGFYLTREQANKFYKKTAEQKEKDESQTVAERVDFEASQSNQKTQSGGVLNKLSELRQKLFGGKQENVQKQSQDTVAVVSETNEAAEKPKNLTLELLQEKQNQITRYLDNVLNKRFGDPDELTEKYLNKNIPKLYANNDFVNFLQKYIDGLESKNESKTDVSEILKSGKQGRDAIKNRIDELYGGGFRISQQRLITMFIADQMHYLGKSITEVSRMNIGKDTVEGKNGAQMKTWYGDEEALYVHRLIGISIGKYQEGGMNADLFRDLRDIIGPDDFMKISKNLIKVAMESNRRYNKETGDLEEIEINKQYAKQVMTILNPDPKIETQTKPTSNVVGIFSKSNDSNNSSQLAA